MKTIFSGSARRSLTALVLSIAALTVCVFLFSGGARAGAADVVLSQSEEGTQIKTASYEALIGTDGTMPSLVINGQPLLKSGVSISRGFYLFQNEPLKLTQTEQPEANVVTAKNDRASIRYEFARNTITTVATNNTEQGMPWVMVLDSNLHSLNNNGEIVKTVLKQDSTVSTWVAGEAKVKISGGDTLWGPWEGLQVWQASLAPHQTRRVVFQIGDAADAPLPPVAPLPQAVSSKTEPLPEAVSSDTNTAMNPTQPSPVKWDIARLFQAPQTFPAPGLEADGVESLFYEGPTWRGKPTHVFAYVGMPAHKPGEKVPGIVLVHGGGGTAFAAWVKLWTSRGYAAIAMDTCGSVPKDNQPQRHDLGGPPGWGGFDRLDQDKVEDQWTYQAVSDVILANSLLKSRPEVDVNRVGITGISWGGYLTCIAASVDPRFKFAAPVYGCGYLGEDSAWVDTLKGMGTEKARKWLTLWDPSQYLSKAKMPFLWVDGTNDPAYPLPSLQKTYRLLPTSQRELVTRVRMPHAHGGPGENPEEIRVFADTFLKGGVKLAHITSQKSADGKASVSYESKRPIVRAELNFTKDTGRWIDRKWDTLPAQLDEAKHLASAEVPEGATVYYLSLIDDQGLIVSSEHKELQHAG